MRNINKLKVIIPIILLAVVGLGAFAMLPSNSLTMDVNPSIEIKTNRLDRVVGIRPLNLDAEELLKEFKPNDKNLEKVVSDLVDLMILTGHIKGGDDNIVMISVKDDTVDSQLLNKVNSAIKAFLENKQIEATILNQAIAKGESKIENSSGRAVVAEKISTLGSDLSLDELSNMSLKQLIKYSKENNIDTRQLFMVVTGNLDNSIKNSVETKGLISKDEAKKIALGLVDGEIVKFELDDFRDDDDTPEYEIKIVKDGVKYEIEIDAISGKVKEFEKENDNRASKPANNNTSKTPAKKGKISADEAKKIALDLVNGTIVKFEEDDDEFELKIVKDSIKYEIEIDAFSGKVKEFEKDDDDDHRSSKPAKPSKISANEAKKIALNLVNGTIVDFEEDDDEFEIEIIKDGIEYEIEIDAYTGKVLEFEIDD